MNAVHDGGVPWWLEPRWTPGLPAPWDIASQFRELLRYSLAGAYQGAWLVTAGLVLAAFGIPVRGILLLPLGLGLVLWVVSVAFLVPRPRLLLRAYAARFPGLWEWSRGAIQREERRAARGVLLLHALVLPGHVLLAGVVGLASPAGIFALLALGTSAVLSLVQVVVLASGWNSAGLRWDAVALDSALRG